MSTNVNALNWSDRFAIIDKFNPADEVICEKLNVSQDELDTARDLRAAGNFKSKPDVNISEFAKMLSGSAKAKKPTVTSHTVPVPKTKKVSTVQPTTATKPVKLPLKRGRKGSKIATAFLAVPSTAVPASEFTEQHGVSLAVLRQSRRFDKSGLVGSVKVKQDKVTKTLMVWREGTE